MTIFDFLKSYDKKRYHTPGHKGVMPFGLGKMDLTEIGDIFPADFIYKAEQRTADIYGVLYCRYLVSGSSNGIKAAIMSVGGDILAFADSHKSIFDGANLAKVKAFVCKTDMVDGLYQVPTVEIVENALKMYPSTRAVVIQSPNYFGQTVDSAVVKFVQDSGRIVINDAAHGAHFVFAGLKQFSLIDIADIAVASAHKTLCTLTQASMLFGTNSSLLQTVDYNLDLLSTTSPSYLLLGSIEYGVDYAKQNMDKYIQLKDALCDLRDSVATVVVADFTRLVIDCKAYGLSGKQLFDELYKFGICAEMYTDRHLVFIVTIEDSVEDILRLKQVLRQVLKI